MCLACSDVWKLTLLGILILGIPELGHTHQAYKSNIPNGDKVSDPCKNGQPWKGVGHRDPEGRGPRNPFGNDFKSSQMVSVTYTSWAIVLLHYTLIIDHKSIYF